LHFALWLWTWYILLIRPSCDHSKPVSLFNCSVNLWVDLNVYQIINSVGLVNHSVAVQKSSIGRFFIRNNCTWQIFTRKNQPLKVSKLGYDFCHIHSQRHKDTKTSFPGSDVYLEWVNASIF
jgi:hypothetical protein